MKITQHLLITVIVILLSACNKKSEISAVWKKHDQITQEELKKADWTDKYWNSAPMILKIADGLDDIDTSETPKDFQEAFQTYVEKIYDLQVNHDKWGGFSGFFKGFFTGGIAIIDSIDETNKERSDLLFAEKRLKKISKEYGVTR